MGSSDSQSGSEEVKGEFWSAIAHLGFAAVMLVFAVILVAVSHGDDISKNLDFIKLYKYKKASLTKSDVVKSIEDYTKMYPWINSPTDVDKCLDVTRYLKPTVGWESGQNPIGSGCSFELIFSFGPMEGQMYVSNVSVSASSGCTQGNYQTALTVASPDGGTVTNSPTVSISEAKVITASSAVIGYDFKQFDADYKSCYDKRQGLIQKVQNVTGCQYEYSSPLCACVNSFLSRFQYWGSKFSYKPKDAMLLGDALGQGVGRCLETRRGHDVRQPVDRAYARSSALLIFFISLFLNGLLNLLLRYKWFRDSTMAYSVFFLLYLVVIMIAGLFDGDGDMAEFETVLALALPAFIVHGGYLILLYAYFNAQPDAAPSPFLHPVTFDVCLASLSVFTLTERGVVQLEYLLAEIFKVHAIAAIYIALVWYHRYGKNRDVLTSEFVQQSYVLLSVVGLVASASGLIVPYPSKSCFEFHWLLPAAFTYVAFSTISWVHHLRMSVNLNSPSGAVVQNYGAVTGFAVLLLGGVFLSYFLSEHIQIYGVTHFAYPMQGDMMTYAAIRDVIVPSGAANSVTTLSTLTAAR